MARTAYAPGNAAVRTPQSIEYEAFARATSRLRTLALKGSSDFPTLARALHENRRLWMTLTKALVDDSNALPDDLRAGLLSLADFTMRHTSAVLSGNGDVRPLLEINIAVMKGLRAQQQAA